MREIARDTARSRMMCVCILHVCITHASHAQVQAQVGPGGGLDIPLHPMQVWCVCVCVCASVTADRARSREIQPDRAHDVCVYCIYEPHMYVTCTGSSSGGSRRRLGSAASSNAGSVCMCLYRFARACCEVYTSCVLVPVVCSSAHGRPRRWIAQWEARGAAVWAFSRSISQACV